MNTIKVCFLMLTWSVNTPVQSHPTGQMSNSYLTADDRFGMKSHQRHRRGLTGARVGLLKLFAGASEIPSLINKGFERTFVKPGSKENAIKDFYATQPTDIQTYYFPLGGKALEGKLGENTIFLRTADMSEGNRPTLWIVNSENNVVLRKLIYQPAKNKKNLIGKGFDRTFVKTGSKENAIKDFYATQPTDIQTYNFHFGGKALEGKLGENTIFLRTADMSEGNRPTLRIVNSKTNELIRKLIYQTATTN